MITHNEESRAQADTNAVQGETRHRALVTTVRGRHSSDRRHYGYQIEQSFFCCVVFFCCCLFGSTGDIAIDGG